jgi:plasmid stabilization system protein ParE
MMQVFFHPEAVAEAQAAHRWYRECSGQAAAAFLGELDDAIAAVAESPERWPEYAGGTRRYLLKRFPFLLVYRVKNGDVQVLAVAHGRRRPGYWRNR